jgi:Xaa-Pro aminopeptidase
MYRQKHIETLREKLREKNLDAVLTTKLENCFYLSGFSGSSGVLFLSQEEALLFTDFRYVMQAKEEAPQFTVVEWRAPVWKDFASKIRLFGLVNFGFEADSLTVGQCSRIREAVSPIEMKEASGLVEELRLVKDLEELGKIRQAAVIADAALNHLVSLIKTGVSERELAIEADYFMRKSGAEAEAFPTIIASGTRSSLPHARPTDRTLQKGDFVLIDLGARYQGYHSDMSRTFVLGSPTEEQRRVYEVVREAQQRALEAVGEKKRAVEVDEAARRVIGQAGWDKYFGHGTGHGLGLEVHEGPRIGPKSEEELRVGMVFTIEPAVYLSELGGVRIEDMVYLGENGPEVLTKFTRELLEL